MKANEAAFLELIKKSPQFSIPIYQRTYSWTEKECRQLWDDILRTGERDDIPSHFIGAIVYITKSAHETLLSPSSLLVIDGQQRLTTLTLLLAALANHLSLLPEAEREPMEGFSPNKLWAYYLINREEEGEKHYKLILTQTDKESLIALLSGKELPRDRSLRIDENYTLFKEWIAAEKERLAVLCRGIAKLMVVEVALDRSHDNPQLIFESMNSTGKELSQADLIRNFILMGLEQRLQTELYEKYWRPMEVDFGQEAYSAHFDAFMRHYLTVKSGEIPKQGEVYEAFKFYARSGDIVPQGMDRLAEDLRLYARFFCAMALDAEKDPDLQRAFFDLRTLKVDVAYPFLLVIYARYHEGLLPKKDFLELIRLVESYVFRRAICEIPTNSLNKTFATFAASAKELDPDRLLEGLKAHFLLLPSYRRFPSDDEFRRDLRTRDLYHFRSRSYWLRRMENHERKEHVSTEEYTVEHIMPQNENLSAAWQTDLGPEWKRIWEDWLHTLGNLTLTGYNSEYSDRPFREKRDMNGGFKESPLKLNKGLGALEKWDENAIKQRAENLSAMALAIWKAPALPKETLDSHRTRTPRPSSYTIDNHPYLSDKDGKFSAKTRVLFEMLRKEILALDPCVTEEFRKLYVAYKAETNFVDVVPQAKRMRLSLNMPFSDIVDPRSLCRDVKGVGRWGNGDVEVFLSSEDEIPYIMSLIRQSFERQMDNGEGE